MNYTELNKIIDESGLKKTAIAHRIGMKPGTLKDRLNGTTEFKLSEVAKISVVLGLNRTAMSRIFFADDVQ